MYVMCFVAAVPTAKRAEYAAHSAAAAKVFKAHGALRVVECWGDQVPPGKLTSFPLAVAAREDETVVTGWQEWPDKATCEANMEKAMSDPKMQAMGEMPFDGKRLIYAGFEPILDV